jgi:cardiolipin synthase A/B
MALILDVLAFGAILLVGFLAYLLLFERGTFYRTSEPIHSLRDDERIRLLSTVLATPFQTVDDIKVLREGPALYAAQVAAISRAQRSVHLEVYIFYPGAMADAIVGALCERARAGVKVRVIVDAIGSFRLPRHHFKALQESGGEIYRYHSLRLQLFRRWNSRTHRNLLITDGERAFIGGAGVADHWGRTEPPPWRDTVVQVSGDIVSELQAVFAENWLISASAQGSGRCHNG